MNTFLIAALATSGAIDLVVGASLILAPTTVAGRWLGTSEPSDPTRVLLFLVGLAALGLAALHATAIRWLRQEKPEGFHLSIGIGAALAVLGVAGFAHARLSGFALDQLPFLFGIDAIRGIVIGGAAITALNAPATVTNLRLPARGTRAAEAGRSAGAGRSTGASRSADRGRSTSRDEPRGGRDSDRRRRGGGGREGGGREGAGREGAGRGGRPRQDARQEGRPGASRERIRETDRRDDRRDDRRGRPAVASREPSAAEGADSLRIRRVTSPQEQRSRTSGPLRPGGREEPKPAGSLGVVVRGDPRSRIGSEPPPDSPARGERRPPRISDAKVAPPSVPSVEESLSRPRGRDRENERDRPREHRREERPDDRGDDQRRDRPRRRRRRTTSREPDRSSASTGPDPSDRSEEPRERIPPPPRSEPSGNRYAVRSEAERPREVEDRRETDRDRGEVSPRPDRPPRPQQEPVDRISSFSAAEPPVEPAAPAETSAFGRQRRPFTPHRKGRQVRPREQRNHRMLGGGWGAPEPEEREPEAAASAPPPAPASRTIDIGLTDGIGPVDLGRIGIDRDSRDDPGDRGEATEHRE